MIKRWLVVLVLVVGFVLEALPAIATTDPYGADPLGVVAYAEQVRVYTGAVDVWDVFICDTPDGTVSIGLDTALLILDQQVRPYFSWLSGTRYEPRFRAGGIFTTSSNSGWETDPFLRQYECEQRAAAMASGSAAGALVVVDVAYSGGYGTAGEACLVVSECASTFPANGRMVVVGAGTVVPVGGLSQARISTVAHEIGHAISFPHSFGGLTTHSLGFIWEYDNPMDVMSGGEMIDLNVGTHALNQYAAGWISAAGAVFHRGGSFTYDLSSSGASRFIVLPTDSQGLYEVLGPRTRTGFDSGIPVEGIEVYRIDQRGQACGLPVESVCWGADRRTAQVPATDSPDSTSHVFELGSTFTVRGLSVEVLSRAGDVFRLRITGAAVTERFIDDNANPHEPAIGVIADRGITLGCNPPVIDRYCPDRSVTRAEMAAFLLRAIGDPGVPTATGVVFTDVTPDAWYGPYVARLFELGITTGYADGTYRPHGAVSRAEMAVFLTRAFSTLAPKADPAGTFADVPASVWYAGAVEGLLEAGITKGCKANPISYCPSASVRRDEMASFLSRSLGS